jgi:amidophosphoribosyltransferase
MSTKNEFIARDRTNAEICAELGCDGLVYQDIDDMVAAVRAATGDEREYCKACFTGEYPTGDITERMLADIEADRLAAARS